MSKLMSIFHMHQEKVVMGYAKFILMPLRALRPFLKQREINVGQCNVGH